MEAEIVSRGVLSPGLVSSTLSYTLLGKDESGKEKGVKEADDQCLVAMSPCMKLVLLVSGYKAQLLRMEGYRDQKLGYMYGTVWEGLLAVVRAPDVPRPTPTTIAMLPLVWEGRGEAVNVLVAGFDDGILRFYRENGTLIFSHQLHKEKIRKLTYSIPLKHGVNVVKQDELVVLYQTVVCVVSGPSVVQCVKECFDKNLLDNSEQLELPSLVYKKWHLQQQAETCDVASLVSSPAPVFDQLSQLSKVKGADATLRGVVPIDRKVIAVGSQPMVALYNVSKDASSIHMTEVVSALTTALTSAVVSRVSSYSSWLGWGSKAGQGGAPAKTPQQSQVVEPTTNVSMSCHLPDATRRVTGVWPSPCGRLLVTTDDFGRVLLITTTDFTAVRMWKGYRSAQCGWIEVASVDGDGDNDGESSTAGNMKTVLCLCIYAAKRGIVELWPVQNGPRIAAFLVGKGCRLLHVHPFVFGEGSRSNACSVCFITTDCQLVSIRIPQHLLLRSGHTHSRDLLLLRKLPQSTINSDLDFIATVFDTIQSSRLCLKAIEVLVCESGQSHLPLYFISQMIDKALKRLPLDCSSGTPSGLLKDHLSRMRQIIALYMSVQESVPQHGSRRHYCELLRENLVDKCRIPPSLSGSLTTALNSYFKSFAAQPIPSVNQLSLKEFMCCFNTEYKGPDLQFSKEKQVHDSSEQSQTVRSKTLVLKFHPKLDGSLLERLGFFLFQTFLNYHTDDSTVAVHYQDCGLQATDLLNALIATWLSKNSSFGTSPLGCLLGLKESLAVLLRADTNPPVDWKIISDHCRKTVNFGHALLLAVSSYTFARTQCKDQETEKDELEQAESEGWETVLEDDDDWFHLLQELEFFTRLSLLSGSKHVPHFPVLPVTTLDVEGRCDFDQIKSMVEKNEVAADNSDVPLLTVAHYKQYGAEVVTQAVADWLISTNLNPVLLKSIQRYYEGIEKELSQDEQLILVKMRQLFQCSPVALDLDTLRVNCVWQACAHCNVLCAKGATKEDGMHQNLDVLECAVDHLLQINSVTLMAAAGHLLWTQVYRTHAMNLIQTVKKTVITNGDDLKLVSLSRQLLGVLVQLCSLQSEQDTFSFEEHSEGGTKSPSFDIVDGLKKSRGLNKEVTEIHYCILICLELVAALEIPQMHVLKVFDIWVQEVVGCDLTQEIVRKKKGRTVAALKHNQLKFLTKALTSYMSRPKRFGPPLPYLKPLGVCTSDSTTADVIFSTWPGLMFHLSDYLTEGVSEEVGVQHIWLLFSAGLDMDAMEAMKSGLRSRLLSEKLLNVAVERIKTCLAEEANASKKASATSLLTPQVFEWMSKQNEQQPRLVDTIHIPSWASTRDLLNVIANSCELTDQQASVVENLRSVVSSFVM